jgi:YggT family protein
MSFGQAIIAYFIAPLLTLLIFVIFANVILSWLIAFNVVNPQNQFVQTVWRFTGAFTDPFLRPLRSVLPNLGGIDLSPLILLLAIFFVRDWLLMDRIYPIL